MIYYCNRPILQLLALMFGLSSITSTHAVSCNTSPVFALSQALYGGHYDEARALVSRVEFERGNEMAQFLTHVINWKQAFDQQDKPAQRHALKSINVQIKALIAGLSSIQNASAKLTAGNIMIHAARMNIASGRVLRASTLIKHGYQLLSDVYDSDPKNVDSFLALGLIYYHAGSDEPGFSWLKQWLTLKGDKIRGRALIEKAVQSSPDFAFEAARSLVMEVAWHKTQLCTYPKLLRADDKINALASSQQQAIVVQLFCGKGDEALARIEKLSAQELGGLQQDWLYEVKLYAYAQTAQVDEINKIIAALGNDQAKKRMLGQFALAKALDLNEHRSQAMALYQRVLASNVGESYKTLAEAYLRRPYELSTQTKAVSQKPLQFACDIH